MMDRQKNFGRTLGLVVLASSLATAWVQRSAQAGELSTRQILDGLKIPKTRSLNASERPTMTADDLAFVNRVRGQSRSLKKRRHR